MMNSSPMSVEYRTETLSLLDPELQNKLAQLTADGWMLVPGTVPVAVYHLQRQLLPAAPEPQAAAVAQISVDESQVYVIPGNKSAN